MGKRYLGSIVMLLLSAFCLAQDLPGTEKMSKYLSSVKGKADEFNSRADKHVRKSINKLMKQEKRMQRKIMKADSVLAKTLFAYAIDSLNKFQAMLKQKTSIVNKITGGKYFARLDTLKQSLRFLEQTESFTKYGADARKKLSASMQQINEMEAGLANVEKLQEFLSDRREVLRSQLKNYPQLSKYITNISKETYYIGEKVKELQSVFSDPSKIEHAVAALLQKIPAFKGFMQQHSQLAGLFSFGNPAGPASPQMPIVNGIAPRAAVQQAIQASAPGIGSNINGFIEQQLGQARSALEPAKNKLNQLGGMGDKEMPDFKPNSQKVKSFKKRLEYNLDMQFSRGSYLLPTAGDFSMGIGYKLNDKSSVGVSGVYKLGLGTGWNNIRFSNLGVGLRSYMNWKIKGGFYVQGGGEWNYNASFKDIDQLKNSPLWQSSAVAGIVKKYQVSKKMKGNVQVMFDFLHKQHIPNTQPVLFRVGCNF
jgi:hypothetical protein